MQTQHTARSTVIKEWFCYACDREGGKQERDEGRTKPHRIQQRTVINYESEEATSELVYKRMFYCLNYNFTLIKFIRCSLFSFNTTQKLNSVTVSVSS